MQQFSHRQFENFSRLVYQNLGIYFTPAKEDMLKIRLDKLMTRNGISSYDEYYNALIQDLDGSYMKELIDEITIHKTDFFREVNHFDFIRSNANYILSRNPRIVNNKEIRVWCSACSTGQEAYTIAMVLKECLPNEITIKILATDVCTKVLSFAQKGLYPLSIRNEIDFSYLNKYFVKTGNEYLTASKIKDIVTFRQFNLMNDFPFTHMFDIIFCRNIMIYFDLPTQQKLLNKLYDVITPGGLLFIGHSESLINKNHSFKYVQPTIYTK